MSTSLGGEDALDRSIFWLSLCHATGAPVVNDEARGGRDLDFVLAIVRAVIDEDVRLDVPLREQGATSFHAVLVASELEQERGVLIDYASVLGCTPREIAASLVAAS